MNNTPIIQCTKVSKTYSDGALEVSVLRNIDFSIHQGESVSIIGASGSGKSTLMHLLGGLDSPSSGEITIMGENISQLSPKEIGAMRNQYLGFVYQFHHLLPEFSALENVMMPLLIAKTKKESATQQALDILDKVGLRARASHRPSELSGGERQRAAIARALVAKPACILADEPTGNLDKKNALNVLDIMLELKTELQTSIVIVTHDDTLAKRFQSVLTMEDGSLQAHH